MDNQENRLPVRESLESPESAVMTMKLDKCLDRYAKIYLEISDRLASGFGGVGVDIYVLGSERNLKSGYYKGPYCTQHDLVEAWIYPKQTIHSSVERLAKRGLLTLEPVPGNRKEKAIVLTDAGRAVADEHIAPYEEAMQRVKARLTLPEQAALTILMDKYIQALEEETKDL